MNAELLPLLRASLRSALLLTLVGGGLWGVGPSRAQPAPTPSEGGCLSFHQIHPSVRASGALQTLPEGFKIYLVAYGDRPEEGLVLRAAPFVDGSDLADAEASSDPASGQAFLILRFSDTGRAKLADFTKGSVGHAIAIVVDGRVISAPLLQEPILDGVGKIGGSLTAPDASELARRLKSRACAQTR